MKAIVLSLLMVAIPLLVILILLAIPQRQIIVQAPVVENRIVTAPSRVPEFRGPPLREYKPANYQQVGLLMSDSETFPLYGRPSYAYNNRWNYYTTTQGEQIYPLPVTSKDRDCTEDIGCDELYGNEQLSILGKTEPYSAKIYRVTTS